MKQLMYFERRYDFGNFDFKSGKNDPKHVNPAVLKYPNEPDWNDMEKLEKEREKMDQQVAARNNRFKKIKRGHFDIATIPALLWSKKGKYYGKLPWSPEWPAEYYVGTTDKVPTPTNPGIEGAEKIVPWHPDWLQLWEDMEKSQNESSSNQDQHIESEEGKEHVKDDDEILEEFMLDSSDDDEITSEENSPSTSDSSLPDVSISEGDNTKESLPENYEGECASENKKRKRKNASPSDCLPAKISKVEQCVSKPKEE